MALKTYQYTETKWIAAPSEEIADRYAHAMSWDASGGEIFDAVETAGMLDDAPEFGGIDVVLNEGVKLIYKIRRHKQ